MAKNKPDLTDVGCPVCGGEDQMEPDMWLMASTNLTILVCPNEECGHRTGKNQSVKLSGNLVVKAADCMDLVGGFSGLGDFVRHCVRLVAAQADNEHTMRGYSAILEKMAEDPDFLSKLLEEGDE